MTTSAVSSKRAIPSASPSSIAATKMLPASRSLATLVVPPPASSLMLPEWSSANAIAAFGRGTVFATMGMTQLSPVSSQAIVTDPTEDAPAVVEV